MFGGDGGTYVIPLEAKRHPGVLSELLRGLFTRRAPSALNFWENMLGAGFACSRGGAGCTSRCGG